MNRKSLLLTLLMALAVPLAVNAQVERTVTVYNGTATSTQIPLDGTHGVIAPAKSQYIMDKAELGDIAGKPITKMAFHIAAPAPVMNSGNHLSYEVLLAEVDETSFTDNHLISSSAMTHAEYVTANVSLNIVDNMLEVNFSEAYIFSGEKNLLVQFSCLTGSQSYYSPWYSTSLRFYGVNVARAGNVDMGYGIYRHYGFVPKTTFTYQDEATWANTNRPQNLSSTVDSDGAHITLNWVAPSGYSGSYQTLCVEHGTTPNWSNAETTSYTTNLFYDLTPNTTYDLYVRAKSGVLVSANAKAIVNTANITDLDNGNLVIDFDGAFVPNGVVATGSSITLETSRYFYMEGNGYGSYLLPSSSLTINLPKLHYTNATNGVIMEFDLVNTENLQVKFNKQGITTDIASYSNVGYGSNMKHYSVRAVDGTGAQDAYFQLVGSFNIDNIIIYKAPTTMKPYNLEASNITTNSATVTWDDDNTGNNVTWYMRYRKIGADSWSTPQSQLTQQEYQLTGLDTYSQYEVQVMAYHSSTDYSDWTESLVFATSCPATPTTYTQQFTNLSDLPSYWRIAKGEGVVYSVNNNRLTVSNTSYQYTSYGSTYTAYTQLDAYVIMPYFENLSTLQLSFKAGRTAGSYNELVVGVMSDPFDVTTFSTLETRILNGPSTTYNISLANVACQHGHIAIRLNHYENNLQNVWFDDFEVTRYAAPTDLTVSNVTNTSATLGWTSLASEFEVQYKTTSASTWTSVSPNPTTNTCIISNLTSDTEYEAQIRAKYGQNLYSPWVSFGSFKTLRQEAVVMNATHTSYLENFQSNNGNWMFIDNGSDVNRWRRFSYMNINYGDLGYGLRVTYSADNSATMSWSYRTRRSYTINGHTSYMGTPATSFAVKTFTLSEGHYDFGYDYAVKGVANSDYMRVVLVPAETELVAGTMPDGFDYQSTPAGWFSLDGGHQISGNPSNNNYYGWTAQSTVSLDVYPGGACEPGNYMMVVLWHNPSVTDRDGQNPPGAISNVSVTWSPILYGPDFTVEGTTDTEATLNLFAPGLGIAPTGYEVQYEPALDYNNYVDAPIVTVNVVENPQTVTLTGLTPKTLYNVRLRSVYTTNGHSIYSDWVDAASCFETKYSRPTDLTVVDQTTSWANVVWAPVEVNLAEGEYINYWWQLTTDPNDWGEYIGQGQVSNSWTQNFVPGTYYFRVSTAVYQENGNLFMGQSDWSEPVAFTIAPWTDPVTIFPLINSFEEWSYRFADGLTLDGTYVHLDITSYSASGLPTPEGGANEYKLQFHSCDNKTAYLVLPPLRPSTSDALVSFWWYHDNSGGVNEGVAVEHSSDGSSWTSFGTMIPRYAEETGWVKYSFVVPSPTSYDKVYVRLHFYGSNTTQWTNCCYLDDLTVNNFKSYQPYIYDVLCDASTADITLYDYGYENGWPSSAFQVQYREYRNPGEPEEEWITYSEIANEAPYTFINHLMVTGLQPATLYEFRACARASYGGFDFPWSNYCEPYRQWTDCGTYLISPSYSYTEDFEELFNGTDCWTIDGNWTMQQSGGHNGDYCAYCPGRVNMQDNAFMTSPAMDFSGCNNVILRFWSKGKGIIRVYYGENFEQYGDICILSATDDWEEVELSLSYFLNKGPVKVSFYRKYNNTSAWYVDDISIIANVYDKIFDCKWNEVGLLSSGINWYPSGVPSATDEVMIMAGSQVYYSNSPFSCGTINFGTKGSVWVRENCLLTVTNFNATKKLTIDGTANITTLNPGFANSVVVNDGGVLNATTITTANAGANDRVVILDGGQVKTENPFYGTIEKNITGYGEGNANWYLVATPIEVMAVPTFVPHINSVPQFDQMDFYWFDGHQELEWINPKCTDPLGCGSPWGTIPQGHFSAEMGQPLHGYLYARQDDGTVQFAAGSVGNTPFSATNVDTSVDLVFYSNSDAPLNGWNLIGNPYTCNAYLLDENGVIMPFYRMNETGDTIVPAQAGTAIKPCEGVFVVCPSDGQSHQAVFTTTAPTTVGEAQDSPMVTVPVHALLGNQEAYLILRQLEELAEGWNWWAPTVQMSVADLQAALDDLEAVISKDGELTNGEDILVPGQMYKLQIGEDCSMNVLGIVVPNASVTIESGYNWFGCTVETDIDDLNITPVEGDKIVSQDQGFAIFNGTSWEGTLTTLEPGMGYVYIR